MGLKTINIELEGKTLIMKELSFAANLRLAEVTEYRLMSIYKEMFSPEDFAYLDTVGKDDFEKVRSAFLELTSTKEDVVEDIKKKEPNGI